MEIPWPFGLRFWVPWVLALSSSAALAATPTLTGSGRSVLWGSGRLELVGNPANRSGLSASQVFDAATRGLQRWKAAGQARIAFDYWQGTDASVYEPNSLLNGHSSLYFASNSGAAIDPQVLGLTQVWYNTETGEILETDIVLNDVDYRFSTRATDTTGYGSGTTTGSTVFIENVLTHEIGHAFGLSHSGAMQSTMLFMESPDQNHLGCDDQAGIRGLYGAGSGGSIRIRVVDPDGRPLLGAQVVALSRLKGTLLRTALTDRDGIARLTGLDPGSYDIMVEPYYAGAAPLPAYYSGMDSRVCSGSSFQRTFRLEAGSQRLAAVGVETGRESDAGTLKVECGWTIGAPSTVNTERTFLEFGETEGAFAARWESGLTARHRLRVEHSGGDLVVRMLSFSLYSPVAVRASLWTERGQGVLISERSPLYQSESGFNNYDTEIRASSLSPGVYYLDLSADAISIQRYPAGPLSRDSQAFYLVSAVRGTLLATQSRCRQLENFAEYQSPPGQPPRQDISGRSIGGFAACASVRNLNGAGRGTMMNQAWVEFVLLMIWMYAVSRGGGRRAAMPAVALARARA